MDLFDGLHTGQDRINRKQTDLADGLGTVTDKQKQTVLRTAYRHMWGVGVFWCVIINCFWRFTR